MPRRYPPEVRRQVIELARSGTKVAAAVGDVRDERGDDLQLAPPGARSTGARSRARAPTWRSSSPRPKRRSGSSRPSSPCRGRSTRCSSSRACPQKALPGDRVLDRAGNQRTSRLPLSSGSRSPAITRGGAARPRRERFGGSSWPARSPTSTAPRAASTARIESPPSCASDARSSSATTRSPRSCASSGSTACPTGGCRAAHGSAASPAPTWCAASSPRRARPAVDDRHHRAPDSRRQDLLLRRPRRVLALVVGWSIDSTQTTVLVTNALGMATRRRDRSEAS